MLHVAEQSLSKQWTDKKDARLIWVNKIRIFDKHVRLRISIYVVCLGKSQFNRMLLRELAVWSHGSKQSQNTI